MVVVVAMDSGGWWPTMFDEVVIDGGGQWSTVVVSGRRWL